MVWVGVYILPALLCAEPMGVYIRQGRFGLRSRIPFQQSPLLPTGAVPRLKTRQHPRMGVHMRVRGTNADEENEDLGDEDIYYHMSALRDDLEFSDSDEDDGIENDDHKPPNTSSAQEMEGIVQSSTAEVDFRPGKVVGEVVPMEELHLGEGIAVPNGGRDLLPPPDMGGKNAQTLYNAATLAYLGDSVWELYLRRRSIGKPVKLTSYRNHVQKFACGEFQAKFYNHLTTKQLLSPLEQKVLKWGTNARITIPSKYSSNRGRDTYTKATALEALLGYLYLSDLARLMKIMGELDNLDNQSKT